MHFYLLSGPADSLDILTMQGGMVKGTDAEPRRKVEARSFPLLSL